MTKRIGECAYCGGEVREKFQMVEKDDNHPAKRSVQVLSCEHCGVIAPTDVKRDDDQK